MPNHLTGKPVASVLPRGMDARLYAKRSVISKRLKAGADRGDCARLSDRLRLEGLSGNRIAVRHRAAAGLRQAEQLPEPIFTPSTKAAVGAHDENITFDRVVATIGGDLAEQVRDATLAIYRFAAGYAAERGILIADTKLEFGTDADGKAVRHGRNADAGFVAVLARR